MIRDITESYKLSFEHHQYTSFSSSCVIHFYSASFRHDLVYKSHFLSLSKNYSVLFLNYLVITPIKKSQKDLPSDFLYLDEWTKERRINLLFSCVQDPIQAIQPSHLQEQLQLSFLYLYLEAQVFVVAQVVQAVPELQELVRLEPLELVERLV